MHKFVGGVQTPGVLIAKRILFKAGETHPDGCGGGSVCFVRREGQVYLQVCLLSTHVANYAEILQRQDTNVVLLYHCTEIFNELQLLYIFSFTKLNLQLKV